MGLLGCQRLYHPDRPATRAERQRVFTSKRQDELLAPRRKLAQKVYHESQRLDWPTPWPVFDPYDDEFHFTLDVCATAANRKCARYFSEAVNGLAQDWGDEICWMNPPYGREIGAWLEKAYRSSLAGATVLCLVPSRTGTAWWHAWVLGKAEARPRKGRITFEGAHNPAGFASVAVIYRPPSTPEEPLGEARRR
jgi:site-specific DNA-methyltransferase (adenine-specific)